MVTSVYEDDPNEPDTVSSGEIAQVAADARDFGAEDPPAMSQLTCRSLRKIPMQ